MKYLGTVKIVETDYLVYFLKSINYTIFEKIVTENNLVDYLSDSTFRAVAMSILKDICPDIKNIIENNNVAYKVLVIDMIHNKSVTSIQPKGVYAINLLVEKDSTDELMLKLSANH